MNTRILPSRRAFLSQTLSLTSGLLFLPTSRKFTATAAERPVTAGNRITLGMIGTGDHGISRNLKNLLAQPDTQIVAVCDVDAGRCQTAKEVTEQHYANGTRSGSFKGCDRYGDFRELLERADIDAVMVSTPDHWHAIPAALAAKAGKDVICEKPLTLTVKEGRLLSDTVKKHGRVFQTSSENRSIWNYLHLCELVRNGRIGKLQHIRVGLPAGRWIQSASREVGPPPKELDYDLWLGPAPEAPYCQARCHWNFRWITDYSGGMLTDWGAHLIDIAQWGNQTELSGPVEIEATGTVDPDPLYDTPTQFEVNCTYANDVRLTISSAEPSIRFVGSEGWVGNVGWSAGLKAEPESILDSTIGPDETRLYTARDEHRNFLDCVKSRQPCYAPAEVGHRTITIAHLGNISMRLRRKLRWDPEKERCTGDSEANRMLSREARPPWQLDKLL